MSVVSIRVTTEVVGVGVVKRDLTLLANQPAIDDALHGLIDSAMRDVQEMVDANAAKQKAKDT